MEPHFGVCLELRRERAGSGFVALEDSVQWHCAPTKVFIFSKELFPGAERSLTCNPIPSVTLQAVLCIAAATREPSQMQQESEALGDIRTGVKPWLFQPFITF